MQPVMTDLHGNSSVNVMAVAITALVGEKAKSSSSNNSRSSSYSSMVIVTVLVLAVAAELVV